MTKTKRDNWSWEEINWIDLVGFVVTMVVTLVGLFFLLSGRTVMP
jgi:hypothetical protein